MSVSGQRTEPKPVADHRGRRQWETVDADSFTNPSSHRGHDGGAVSSKQARGEQTLQKTVKPSGKGRSSRRRYAGDQADVSKNGWLFSKLTSNRLQFQTGEQAEFFRGVVGVGTNQNHGKYTH